MEDLAAQKNKIDYFLNIMNLVAQSEYTDLEFLGHTRGQMCFVNGFGLSKLLRYLIKSLSFSKILLSSSTQSNSLMNEI